jgi:hypothetical protein
MAFHEQIMLQNGPLFTAAIVLVLAGAQLLCLGLTSEVLSRTYYESQKKPIYAAREIRRHEFDLNLALEPQPGTIRGREAIRNRAGAIAGT